MSETAPRSVTYLQNFRFLALGESAVTSTAAAVLTALGATVRVAAVHSGQVVADEWPGYDAVICDRVRHIPDDRYRAQVDDWLAAGAASPGRAWVTVSAFGMEGPASGFAGSELVLAAAGGLLAAIVDEDGHQHTVPGQQARQTAAHVAVLGALYGVSLAAQLGHPVHLDLSAQEAVAFCTNQQTPMHLLNRCAVPSGPSRYSAPSDPFPCTDGQVQIIVVDDHQFAHFCETIGRPDLIDIFPTLPDRVQYAEVINSVTAEWTRLHSKDHCEAVLQAAGVPASAVRSIAEVVASPQFRAREWPAAGERGPDTVVLPALVTRRPIGEPVPRRSLADLHVLEFSNVLAGPLACAILGAMGAEVVRVEDPDRLDMYRQNGPFADGIRGPENSAYFQGANYSKRSIRSDGDAVVGARRWADAIVENVGIKRVEQAGVAVDPPDAKKASLVLSVSGFGRSGPCAGFRGYAQNVHAFAGLEDAVEEAAKTLVTMRMVLADYTSAVWAATVCAAWWMGGTLDDERVDLSMSEVVANRMPPPGDFERADHAPDETDLVVELSTGVTVAVTVTGEDWPARIVAALEGPPPGSGSASEPPAPDEAVGAVRRAASADLEGTVARLQEAGVASYGARNPEALIADRQLASREFFMPLHHPVIGPTRIMALPWQVVGRDRSASYRPAPLLGADEAWARDAFAGRE